MYATRCRLTVTLMQPGDAIYEAGLEWSLASVGWHQYSDVNPSSIDGHYEG